MKNIFESRKFYIIVGILIFLGMAGLMIALFYGAPDPDQKVIKGMTIEQRGLNIEVRWDPVECDGYEIKVRKGLFDTQTRRIESSGFRIRHIETKKEYKIEVRAILDDGDKSEPAYGSIETKRLKQKISAELEEIEGFTKDSIALDAEGKGTLTYVSKNRKIAAVNKKGTVTLKSKGTTTIVIKASGNENYRPGRKKISVTVYPENLPKVTGLKCENISDTRAKVSWDRSDFATGYRFMKLNVATKEYEEMKSLDGDETFVEITRNTGKYAVKPVAVLGDEKADGEVSDPVEVKGTTEDAKSYSSGRNIKTLNGDNLQLIREIHGDQGVTVPQSLSMTDDCYVVSYVNQSGSRGKLISYRKSDAECVDITDCSSMGHANGTTYDPNKNRFYVVKTHKSIRTASCSSYNGKTKNLEKIFNLPRTTSGIAYDVSNNKYYLSKGNEIYVCDSNFNVEKFIHKFVRYNHAQDVGAYNGAVLVCTWVSGSTSYIDIYRASDGAYLGSYDVSIGEIESCVVDDGYLVILMNTLGSNKDRLYKTKERIAF